MKLAIARKLFQRGYSKAKIESLLNFIKYYVNFEVKENFDKFEKALINSDRPMGIKEAILKDVRDGGFAEGIEQGIERGIEKGEAVGSKKQAKASIKVMLEKGFELPAMAEILQMTEDRVQELILELQEEGVLETK